MKKHLENLFITVHTKKGDAFNIQWEILAGFSCDNTLRESTTSGGGLRCPEGINMLALMASFFPKEKQGFWGYQKNPGMKYMKTKGFT